MKNIVFLICVLFCLFICFIYILKDINTYKTQIKERKLEPTNIIYFKDKKANLCFASTESSIYTNFIANYSVLTNVPCKNVENLLINKD